jgi:hypothetical protein
VVGLAPDHGPQAGDALVAARLRAHLGPERQLERTGHVVDVNLRLRNTLIGKTL